MQQRKKKEKKKANENLQFIEAVLPTMNFEVWTASTGLTKNIQHSRSIRSMVNLQICTVQRSAVGSDSAFHSIELK